jgi:hypothetical protein
MTPLTPEVKLMRKQAPNIEWQIVENDVDWERLSAEPLLASNHALQRKRTWWSIGALFLLLGSAGGWLWHTGAAALPQATADVTATAQPALGAIAAGRDIEVVSLPGDQADPGRGLEHGQDVRTLRAVLQTAEPDAYADVPLHTIQIQGDLAVARVVMYTEHGAPAYRQTRFYRRIGPNWRQTAPDATLWGPEHSLETRSFVYHFRQNDEQAVIAVAPQMDAMYHIMWRNFGLPISRASSPLPTMFGGEKLFIDVSVTQPPGQAIAWFSAPDRIIVPSPALYLAPVELTDVELLAQSLALALSRHVLAQASEHHAIGAAWQPMVKGLRLWQVWDLDLPLAAWREEVVQWVYVEGPAVGPGQSFVLPNGYPALCAAHKLWLPSPAELNLPLICGRPEWEEQSFPLWRLRDPLARLDQFVAPLRPGGYLEEPDSLRRSPHPGQTVALATLIEYAVAAYGRERLPALVAGLGQYETWDALLSAVYGVSAAEFEIGWQAYLAAHFDISQTSSRNDKYPTRLIA